MHKNLKRFGMEGTIKSDADFLRLRDQYERMVVLDMREHGYVPILGLGPFWATWYDLKKDWYEFVLSIHGIYVGRRESSQVEGMSTDGNMLMKPPTPPSKSSTSSESAE